MYACMLSCAWYCHTLIHSRMPATLSLADCANCYVQTSLSKLLLFERLDKASQIKVVEHTWTRQVSAGEILIQEGETGLAASELYVVKGGAFEVCPATTPISGPACIAGSSSWHPAVYFSMRAASDQACRHRSMHASIWSCRVSCRVSEAQHWQPVSPVLPPAAGPTVIWLCCRCWSAARASTCVSTPRSAAMCLARCPCCTTAPVQPQWLPQQTQQSGCWSAMSSGRDMHHA